MRICFLIAAHARPEMLRCALRSVASPRHLVRVHLDRKSRTPELAAVVAEAAQTGDVAEVPGVSVAWGGFSQVGAELRALEVALAAGEWDYLAFMSGADLLVRPLAYLEALLAEAGGKSFMDRRAVSDLPPKLRGAVERRSTWVHAEIAGRVVKLPIPLRWLPGEPPAFYGSQWHFLHRSLCEEVVELVRRLGVPPQLKYCMIPDEVFWQNIVSGLPDADRRIVPENHRYAVFGGARNPRWLRMADVPEIERSGAMMARKFDPELDAEVVRYFLDRTGAS